MLDQWVSVLFYEPEEDSMNIDPLQTIVYSIGILYVGRWCHESIHYLVSQWYHLQPYMVFLYRIIPIGVEPRIVDVSEKIKHRCMYSPYVMIPVYLVLLIVTFGMHLGIMLGLVLTIFDNILAVFDETFSSISLHSKPDG